MRNYFIRYNPEEKVNYLYLFMLYGLAKSDKDKYVRDTITYSTKKELADRLKAKYGDNAMSYSTLTRIMQNTDYNNYFTMKDKKIILNNHFGAYSINEGNPFVIINSDEANFLIEQKDSLLARYYCFLKYYCGLAERAGIKQDFTAKQFLATVGLSPNNHNNLSKISSYNTLLSNEHLIKIEKYRDCLGNERNIYYIVPHR